MPIYSLTYLNTSTVELNPHLYRCMGSMHSEVQLGVPGTHVLRPSRGNGSPEHWEFFCGPAGAGRASTLLYIQVVHTSRFKLGTVCVLMCACSTFLPYNQFNGNLIYLKEKKHK